VLSAKGKKQLRPDCRVLLSLSANILAFIYQPDRLYPFRENDNQYYIVLGTYYKRLYAELIYIKTRFGSGRFLLRFHRAYVLNADAELLSRGGRYVN